MCLPMIAHVCRTSPEVFLILPPWVRHRALGLGPLGPLGPSPGAGSEKGNCIIMDINILDSSDYWKHIYDGYDVSYDE